MVTGAVSPHARIGVWNTAFLGDSVLTLPLIQSLRDALPGACIHYYVRKGLGGLYAENPSINAVFEHDKHSKGSAGLEALRLQCAEVRSRRYDIWISPHQSLRSALIAMASGAADRVGFNAPWFNALCYTKRVKRLFPDLHEIDRVLELLRPLGLSVSSRWPQLSLPEDAFVDARQVLAPLLGKNAPVLGLHPGSVWATKRWPAEYYARLAVQALQSGASIALFAGKGEEQEAGVVAKAVREACQRTQWREEEKFADLSGQLPLPVLAACLGLIQCYVTNDSGPMHLAWVQRTPVVALFGPTVPAFGFTPLGEHARIVEVEGLKCRPCGLHGPQQCPLGHHRCMRDLMPETVWSVTADLMRQCTG